MKIILSFSIAILFSNLIIAQTTAIPDTNFEQALINLGLDGSLDGQVLTNNIDTVTFLDVDGSNIINLTGIEDFVSLITLHCYNNQLNNLNITQNTALTSLICYNNQLTSLDVTQNTALIYLNCNDNMITAIDVTQNTALENLQCISNQLTSLNVTQNTALTWLDLPYNQLTSLDVTQNTALTSLVLHNNQLTSLDVTQITALIYLNCHSNILNSLNVTQNTNLTTLHCCCNQLASIDVSQNTALTFLNCHSNQLNCLNVKNGNNTNFTTFWTEFNPNLNCIEVDNVTYSTTNWTAIDATSSFSTNCPSPCTVGIDELETTQILIYPNPTNGSIAIDLGELKTNIKATLTNNLGQVIFVKQYTSSSSINLNIDDPKGMYFLQLESNGEIISRKIIKE